MNPLFKMSSGVNPGSNVNNASHHHNSVHGTNNNSVVGTNTLGSGIGGSAIGTHGNHGGPPRSQQSNSMISGSNIGHGSVQG